MDVLEFRLADWLLTSIFKVVSISGSDVSSSAKIIVFVCYQLLEWIGLLTVLAALKHEIIEDILQNGVHHIELGNFVACRALKLVFLDVGVLLVLRKTEIAILATELFAVGAF